VKAVSEEFECVVNVGASRPPSSAIIDDEWKEAESCKTEASNDEEADAEGGSVELVWISGNVRKSIESRPSLLERPIEPVQAGELVG